MRKKLLFYSDCYLFGGCETLLVNLINSDEINDIFCVHYAYAWSKEYQDGLDSRLCGSESRYPLRVLSNTNLFYRIDLARTNRHGTFIRKLPFVLLQRIGIYRLFNLFRLYFFFRKIKPDILHINDGGYPGAPSCLVAVFSAKMAGIQHIVFNVNNLAHPQKNTLAKWIDEYVAKNVDYFITASAQARNKLIEYRRFAPAKILQIFNALGEEEVLKSRQELLAAYDVTADRFIIATVALLTERKGQTFLLNALHEIKQRDADLLRNIVLFLVGDGEDRSKLECLIQEYQLSDNVIITGYRNDYYDFINAADLFILPSVDNEDMPLVILSAMKLGKTIISTKVGGIVEEIRDGIDGVLLDPSKLQKLPLVIEELYNNRPLRERYGGSAKKRYHDCFSNENTVSAYINIYRELLSRVD
ncbi:MAG: glycosyltransferase family 4 protein [Syntrophales bacterium]